MTAPLDLSQLVQQWRTPMLRFARLHLQPMEDAEDAVQDTLAALLGADPAALAVADPRPYLFGILRHKITDRLRAKYRPEIGYSEAFVDDIDDTLFDDRGHWVDGVAPSHWVTPHARLEADRFFAVVDHCVERLPAKPARVFSMKQFLECEADEICATLGLTQADYWQCMSRARKQIQFCLTQHWFEGVAPC